MYTLRVQAWFLLSFLPKWQVLPMGLAQQLERKKGTSSVLVVYSRRRQRRLKPQQNPKPSSAACKTLHKPTENQRCW